jgi:hypothetical protein
MGIFLTQLQYEIPFSMYKLAFEWITGNFHGGKAAEA